MFHDITITIGIADSRNRRPEKTKPGSLVLVNSKALFKSLDLLSEKRDCSSCILVNDSFVLDKLRSLGEVESADALVNIKRGRAYISHYYSFTVATKRIAQ